VPYGYFLFRDWSTAVNETRYLAILFNYICIVGTPIIFDLIKIHKKKIKQCCLDFDITIQCIVLLKLLTFHTYITNCLSMLCYMIFISYNHNCFLHSTTRCRSLTIRLCQIHHSQRCLHGRWYPYLKQKPEVWVQTDNVVLCTLNIT